MALTTPILYTVSAFDKNDSKQFNFFVRGGDQVGANRLTIETNPSSGLPQQVYSQIQSTYSFTHVLPANILTNGVSYQAYVQTYAATDTNFQQPSTASNIIQFTCYSTPTLIFTNVTSGGQIQNSNYTFIARYSQNEGEILNAYVFNLYDSSSVLISTSGNLYNTSSVIPTDVSYNFNGFENNTQYYIEVNGVTANGTNITTGKIRFTVDYIAPVVYSLFYLTNNCSEGYITIRSNVQNIQGISYPDPPTYINDSEVDLHSVQGSYVEWNDNYIVPDNYTLRLWGRNFTPNSEILSMYNSDGANIKLYYCVDEMFENAWLLLTVTNPSWLHSYIIESNRISYPSANTGTMVWLRCVDNIYELEFDTGVYYV